MDTAPAPAKAKKAGMVKAKEESEEEEDDDEEDDDEDDDEEGEFMAWLQMKDHSLVPIHRISGAEAEIHKWLSRHFCRVLLMPTGLCRTKSLNLTFCFAETPAAGKRKGDNKKETPPAKKIKATEGERKTESHIFLLLSHDNQ